MYKKKRDDKTFKIQGKCIFRHMAELMFVKHNKILNKTHILL